MAGTPRRPRVPQGRPAPEFEAPQLRDALDRLLAATDRASAYAALAEALAAVRAGHLIVDVTGSTSVDEARVRTITAADGRRVLPVYTAMRRLRQALPPQQQPIAKAAVLTGPDALELLRTADCAAVQFDAGPEAVVVQRALAEAALGGEDPTAETLERLSGPAV